MTKETKLPPSKRNALANLTDEQLASLSIFGRMEENKINHFIPPYSVRNDCKLGMWKVGDDDLLGKELEFSIVKMFPYYGCLGKSDEVSWLQLWIVGAPGAEGLPRNTVAVTYVKKESLTKLGAEAIKQMETADPGLGLWKASFEKKAGNYGDYYVVKWEWRERETEQEWDQLRLIADFLISNPSYFDPQLPATMIAVPSLDDPIALNEAHKEIKAIKEAETQKRLQGS